MSISAVAAGNDSLDGGTGTNRLAADFSDHIIEAITFVSGQTNNLLFALSNPDEKAINFQKLGVFFYTGSKNDTIRIEGAGDEDFANDIRTGIAGTDRVTFRRGQ